MPRRELELVEVVLGRLDLAVVADLVAEAEERVLDRAPDLGDRVQVPAGDGLARERDVDPLLREPPLELGALELRLAPVERRLEPLARRRSAPCRSRGRAPRAARASGRSCGRGSGRARPRARQASTRPRSRQRLAFERLDVHAGDCRRLFGAHGVLLSVGCRRTVSPRARSEEGGATRPRPRTEPGPQKQETCASGRHAPTIARTRAATIAPWRAPTTRSRTSTTRGAGASIEDVDFYVREALSQRRRARSSSSASAPAGSPSRSPQRGHPRDRRRRLARDAARLPGAGARRARQRARRPAPGRPAQPARAGARPARALPVPLVPPPAHRRRAPAGAGGGARAARARRAARLRRLRAGRGRHRGDARPLARARARHLRARRLGRGDAHASRCACAATTARRRWSSPGSRPASGARCSRRPASRCSAISAGSTAGRTRRGRSRHPCDSRDVA